MAKLFHPIRFWIARFTSRKSSDSSSSSCPSRPSPGLQPATRTVAGFRSPSFGPPIHQHAHFRHRGAPVYVSLRPSATVAAWHPGPAAPFRGKASVRLVCGSACLGALCSKLTPRNLRRAAFVRLHPRPGNEGNAEVVPARQPAAARHRSRLSLSASGRALPIQAGLLQANTAAISLGVNQPSLRHAGSRLVFYRPPVTAMSSSHRLTAAGFRSLPGETRLTKGFCPFPPPIRQ